MPSPLVLGGIGVVIIVVVAVIIYFATQGGGGSPGPAPGPSGTPSGGPPGPTPPPPPPAGFTASSTAPSYALPGYHPIPLANLPSTFTLKNTATGKYWGVSNGQVTDGGPTAILSADAPSDLYSATGTGTYRLAAQGASGNVRHSGYVMWTQQYAPGNYDFAWQIFLKDGTSDQVAVWNPYPGNGTGYWVVAGSPTTGRQQIVNTTSPTVFTLAAATSTTPTSTYMPEPYTKW
jgi:hypothetical protein